MLIKDTILFNMFCNNSVFFDVDRINVNYTEFYGGILYFYSTK